MGRRAARVLTVRLGTAGTEWMRQPPGSLAPESEARSPLTGACSAALMHVFARWPHSSSLNPRIHQRHY